MMGHQGNIKHLLFVTVNLFLIHASVESETRALFQRMMSLDGKICQSSDIAFNKEAIQDKTLCLLECMNHISCASIFHVPGNCTGCKVSYGTAPFPTGLAEGTIYYGPAIVDCPEGWFSIENSCYIIPDDVMNFETGVEYCESLDAHVVTIDNTDENNSLKSKINSMTFTGDANGFFTAFTDIDEEGTWTVYGTTDPMPFQDWAIGEPNGWFDENCMAIYISHNLQWVDIGCQTMMKTICEKEK